MFVKLILCRVADGSRAAFARGQTQWAALAKSDGFCGQVGGWCMSDSELAVIVALWRDETSYQRFMRDDHDPIFHASGQRDSYETIDVSLWNSVLPIPGVYSSVAEGLPHAGVIRIARCQVNSDRRDHFFDAQRGVWNPGMGETPGMLGGIFSQHSSGANEFLVNTLWTDQQVHSAYMSTVAPGLRSRATVDRDCTAVTSWVVPIEENWLVLPG